MRSPALAATAGCFGALAAVCGKLAGQCGSLPGHWAWAARGALYGLLLLVRGRLAAAPPLFFFFFATAAAFAAAAAHHSLRAAAPCSPQRCAQCNVVMLTCYVRSLRRLPSLQATLISNAANMAVTGAAGFAAFSEPLGARWLAGIACVLCGLVLISKASLGSSSGGGAQSPAARPRTRAATRAAKEE